MSEEKFAELVASIEKGYLQDNPLHYRKINDEQAERLATTLTLNTHWEDLYLCHNEIGNAGAIAIATKLLNHTTMKELDLSNNKIGDLGAKAFAAKLINNTTLKNLNFSNNMIGSEGIKALATMLLKNTTLEELSLDGNEIDDEATKALTETLFINKIMSYELFSRAIKKGNPTEVNRLLEIPNILDTINRRGHEFFELAKHSGHLSVVNRLLELPAMQTNIISKNEVIISVVKSNQNLHILNRILEIPEVVNVITLNGNDVLRTAVNWGCLLIVNRLLEIQPVLNTIADSFDDTRHIHYGQDVSSFYTEKFGSDHGALRKAVKNNNLDIIFRLLKAYEKIGKIFPDLTVQGFDSLGSFFQNYGKQVNEVSNIIHKCLTIPSLVSIVDEYSATLFRDYRTISTTVINAPTLTTAFELSKAVKKDELLSTIKESDLTVSTSVFKA